MFNDKTIGIKEKIMPEDVSERLEHELNNKAKITKAKRKMPPMTELDKYIVANAAKRYQQCLDGRCSSVEEAFAEIKKKIEMKYHNKI